MSHSVTPVRPGARSTRRAWARTVGGTAAVAVVAVAALSSAVTAHALIITEVNVQSSPFGVVWLGGDTYFTEAQSTTPGNTTNDQIAKLPGGTGSATTVASLASNSNPKVITAGPDGALWFTEQHLTSSKIGRVTTTGTLTETTLTSGAGPVGITTGPDGNLWFTEPGDNTGSYHSIGRLVPCASNNCTVTEYALAAGAQPLEITGGPAGTNSVWWTERGGSIGEATIGSSVTLHEFAVPTTGASPYGITVGGDNNVWFTEHNGNKVGKVDVTCALGSGSNCITEYSVPTFSSAPAGIAKALDGSLWFTEQRGNKVGNIDTTGTFRSEYEIPTVGSNPLNLTSNGNRFWFTESATDKIGYFDVGSGTTGYVLDVYGGLHPYYTSGTTPPVPSGNAYWAGSNIARGVAVAPGTDSGYTLDGFGGVHPFRTQNSYAAGTAATTTPGYHAGSDIFRDLVVRPDGRTGYELDGFGGIHPWAVAGVALPPNVTVTGYHAGSDLARRLVLNPADPSGESGYVLDEYGGLNLFYGPDTGANAPIGINTQADGAYYYGFNIIRDFVVTDNGGGYSLDGYGGIHPLGNAPKLASFVHDGIYFGGWDICRALVLTSDQTGAYVLDGYGGMHPIGTAPGVTVTGYYKGSDITHDARSIG